MTGHDIEVQLAGGAAEQAAVDAARAAGVNGLILGEALFSGAIDFGAAQDNAKQATGAVARQWLNADERLNDRTATTPPIGRVSHAVRWHRRRRAGRRGR